MLLGFFIVPLFGGDRQLCFDGDKLFLCGSHRRNVCRHYDVCLYGSDHVQDGHHRKLIEILNSLIGGIRGGPGYVAVAASALLGLVAGNSTANAATVGSFTIPWMKSSGWPKETAATITAGNAGSGQSFPAASVMFLMLGMPQIAALVTIDTFILPC